MMSTPQIKPQTKNDVIEQLRRVQQSLADTVTGMSAQQFSSGSDDAWPASGYLKHLILSVKPVAKAINLGPAQIQTMFGQPDHPSRSFDEMVEVYQARLADGIRAEDYDRVTPSFYRIPEGVENEQAYLVETWNESNQRLLDALDPWEEAALDSHQLPHPAVGAVTVREMLFFTLYHNTLHWHDIEQAGANATV